MWKCKVCTLKNLARARKCAACNRPHGRTRARTRVEPSVKLEEDRAYAADEEIVVDYVNPHQNSFDVIAIVPSDTAKRDGDHWPISGVTPEHWKYVGDKSNKNQWSGCLRKEPVRGTVSFEPNSFNPGSYQIQLREFLNGSWSNVASRGRLDVAKSAADAKRLPPPSCHPDFPSCTSSSSGSFPPKRKHRALVGLQNIGNTCYMNAAVQCLATLTPMMDAFLPRTPGPEPPSSGRTYSLDIRKNHHRSAFDLPLDSPKLRTKKRSPSPPSDPPVVLKNGEWRCSACTYINEGGLGSSNGKGNGSIRCQLCGKLAGRDVREQLRKKDVDNQPQVSLDKPLVKSDEEIYIDFKDPLARPYTVLCIISDSVKDYGKGHWPVAGWDMPGVTWLYSDGTSDSGTVGRAEGVLAFSAKRIGGGKFQAQLRRYVDGNWCAIQASAPLTVEGPPLKAKVRGGRKAAKVEQNGDSAGIENENGTTGDSGVKNAKNSNSNSVAASLDPKDSDHSSSKTTGTTTISPLRRKALKAGVLSDEFTRLVHTLSDFEIDGKYICPEYLKSLIEYVRPEFKGTGQHDCQEFTQALLDELNRDLSKVDRNPKRKKRRSTLVSRSKAKKRKINIASASLEHEPPPLRARLMWQALRRPNGSLISELFFGMLENRIECQQCNYQSTVYSTFSTVSLDIPPTLATETAAGSAQQSLNNQYLARSAFLNSLHRSSRGTRSTKSKSARKKSGNSSFKKSHLEAEETPKTLHECFQDFTKEERLDGSNAYYCSRCNKRQEATKRMMFYHLPPVLIVHLKRFSPDGSGKADSQIAFPNELDLSKYCLRSSENYASMMARELGAKEQKSASTARELPPVGMQDCRYRLVGVVNHQQNDGYKHYTAMTLVKFADKDSDDTSADSDSNGENGFKKSGVDTRKTAAEPFFGCVYEDNRAGWVEFDDEKAWRLSTHEARSERAALRTRKEAYLLFYEAVKPG